jgi:hypothetical protein
MVSSLTPRQSSIVRLFEAYPNAFVFEGPDKWRFRKSAVHTGPTLTLDGRAVHWMQRRGVLTTAPKPLSVDGPFTRVWVLNRTHPHFLAW